MTANAFLHGVLGGGQFIDNMYARKAERDWQDVTRQRQQQEWQRADDLRTATADYYEQHDRMQELQTLYDTAKTLPASEQQKIFDYATSTLINEMEPELVNMGAQPGQHKALLPPKMVPGGFVPQVAVIDDKTGKTLRTDNLTMNRSTGGQPMMASGAALPEYFVASSHGREALRKLRKKVIELGGSIPEQKQQDRFGESYLDQYGNRLQTNLTTGKSHLVVSAQKSGRAGSGKSSDSSGNKNMQVLYTSQPTPLKIGVDKDGNDVVEDAVLQRWYDPNTKKFYEGRITAQGIYGQAREITQEMLGLRGAAAGGLDMPLYNDPPDKDQVLNPPKDTAKKTTDQSTGGITSATKPPVHYVHPRFVFNRQ